MTASSVYILQNNELSYPSSEEAFSPNILFPEYPWAISGVKKNPNAIYAAVRDLFYGYGLDKKNFGTSLWNPLGHLIKPGMTVLLKPNMVLSRATGTPFTALITNPAIVRAVIDYVCIALHNDGNIIIADAPLQSCDFDELLNVSGYRAIQKFYRERDVNLEIVDLRQYRSRYRLDGQLTSLDTAGDPAGYVVVDIGDYSAHVPVRHRMKNYRVTNYDPAKMRQYHNTNYNKYLISKSVLSADAVISLPKLKTHRKAGITASLKNNIGIIGHKDCLPHHCRGASESGYDEYLYNNIFKDFVVQCNEWCDVLNIKKKFKLSNFVSKIRSIIQKIALKTEKDPFTEGSWYGNDTIWRTTLDLSRILQYASKSGVLCEIQQRKVLCIADAVVAGEGEGPLMPTPKNAGLLAISENTAALDAACAIIMGFDIERIPTVRESFTPHLLPLSAVVKEDVMVLSNVSAWAEKHLAEITPESTLHFDPPEHWKGHIERM